MKRAIIVFAILKMTLLMSFWILSFSSCQSARLADFEPNSETQSTVSPTATPTSTPEIQNDNINRSTSEPYKGDLSIFEGEDRAKNLQIDRVMEVLKISEGKTVADIGAGSGWFTVRAAKKVGAKGKVFAVEISKEAIKHINERKIKENLLNIETILGKEDDPLLPKNSTDAVLILKTYHEIAQPVRLMKNLLPALRQNSLVGIIDRNGDGGSHGINRETVVEEMKRAGFSLAGEYDFVKGDGMDFLLIFQVQNK